ncbi:hypothetical protein [Streptomyces sp. NPDC055085]
MVGALRRAEAQQDSKPGRALEDLTVMLLTIAERYAAGRVDDLLDADQLAEVTPAVPRERFRAIVVGLTVVAVMARCNRSRIARCGPHPSAAGDRRICRSLRGALLGSWLCAPVSRRVISASPSARLGVAIANAARAAFAVSGVPDVRFIRCSRWSGRLASMTLRAWYCNLYR